MGTNATSDTTFSLPGAGVNLANRGKTAVPAWKTRRDSAGARALLATAAASAQGRSGWVYPRQMPGKRDDSDSAAESAEPAPLDRGLPAREESYGPLHLARHAKGDGRALILYRRSGDTRA